MDRETQRSKGFGFVEMNTPEEANAAIQKLNDSMVEDRKIVVNIARPREERPRDNNGSGNRGDTTTTEEADEAVETVGKPIWTY